MPESTNLNSAASNLNVKSNPSTTVAGSKPVTGVTLSAANQKGARVSVKPEGARDVITAIVGMEVVRGPDWIWGEQDVSQKVKGPNVGIITSVDAEKRWVSVRFGQVERNYRAGSQDRYDLRFFIRHPQAFK